MTKLQSFRHKRCSSVTLVDGAMILRLLPVALIPGSSIRKVQLCRRTNTHPGSCGATPRLSISDQCAYSSTAPLGTGHDASRTSPPNLCESWHTLWEEWEDPASLRQALSPMRTPGAGAASAGDGVKDSLVRMLLHVDPLQTDLATKLLEKLPELEDEMDTDGNSMPLPRLIVSQFRWLEYVVDGEKMVDSVRETMEVHDPACSTVPRPTPAQYAVRELSAPCTTTCPILVSPFKHRS